MLKNARAYEPEVLDLIDSLDLELLYLPSLDQVIEAAQDQIYGAAQARGARVA